MTAAIAAPETRLQTRSQLHHEPAVQSTKTAAPPKGLQKAAKFLAAFGLAAVLISLNLSGYFYERDWTALACILPQALGLGAIVFTYFAVLFFADI